MTMYKEGITVGQLIDVLNGFDIDLPVFVCSDEEGNTTFRGIIINEFSCAIDIRGLSGCEL